MANAGDLKSPGSGLAGSTPAAPTATVHRGRLAAYVLANVAHVLPVRFAPSAAGALAIRLPVDRRSPP